MKDIFFEKGYHMYIFLPSRLLHPHAGLFVCTRNKLSHKPQGILGNSKNYICFANVIFFYIGHIIV